MAGAESTTRKICSFPGCKRPYDSRGLCLMHYKRALKSGEIVASKSPVYPDTCIAPGCGLPSTKKGCCEKHYRRMKKNGIFDTIRRAPGSPLPRSDGYIDQNVGGKLKLQHIIVSEKALGKELPKGAEVHHINEDRSDNRGGNLVICPDRQYHMILHARQRAKDACGNPDWKKCSFCKQYDAPENMSSYATRGKLINRFYHKECAANLARDRKRRIKSEREK